MPLDERQIKDICRESWAQKFDFVLVPGVPDGVYNAVPANEWQYLYVHNPMRMAAGASYYLAVHKSTGQVRDIGWCGE
jgi:hypothetical protein